MPASLKACLRSSFESRKDFTDAVLDASTDPVEVYSFGMKRKEYPAAPIANASEITNSKARCFRNICKSSAKVIVEADSISCPSISGIVNVSII